MTLRLGRLRVQFPEPGGAEFGCARFRPENNPKWAWAAWGLWLTFRWARAARRDGGKAGT